MSKMTEVLNKIQKRLEANDHKQNEWGCSCEIMAYCRWVDSAVDCQYRVIDYDRKLHCESCLILQDGTALCENQAAIDMMS